MVGAPSVPRGFVIISDQPNALVSAFSELLVEPMKGEGIYEWNRERHDDGQMTREELYAEAQRRKIPGRSKMSKSELERASH